jgi:L-rhamnose mutarotase
MMGRLPNQDDAKLILQLYEMRREPRLRAARSWFSQKALFKTIEDWTKLAPGTEENESLRMVTTYWEMVASLLNAGVLHKDLFFQSGLELLFCWERIRDVVPTVREMNKNPYQFKNLEAISKEFIAYLETAGPEAYPAFSKRVRRD